MSLENLEVPPDPYYVALGRSHDCIMRCKDCQGLVTYATITKIGCCDHCGNRRFGQITVLTDKEMDAIKSGEIDFEDREKFIAEFPPELGVG